uniref:Uncharacterized protein n=1 Tax=Dermonema virens TaxID=1077399 RepID=A0A1G4NS16_9FLOR|nr:Hypothetical protein ORF_11 [Dermonema virens]SCW21424.1 Hypothetical protein ORF_11 [Dermonema virens]
MLYLLTSARLRRNKEKKETFLCTLLCINEMHIHCFSLLEVYKFSIDFLFIAVNSYLANFSYMILVMFYCRLISPCFLLMQVDFRNLRAISLYFWLGYSITGFQYCNEYPPAYIKLKIGKSKTKNSQRKFLISLNVT